MKRGQMVYYAAMAAFGAAVLWFFYGNG